MKLRMKIGLPLFCSSFDRVVFLITGFTCAHLKSSGNKSDQSVIGLIKTSRHAFCSTVGSGSRPQDLLGDDLIIFRTSAVVAGSNDAS